MSNSTRKDQDQRTSRKASGYSDQTKEDLQKKAKQLDIEGYSQMNKDELVDALEKQRR